jgi:lipoprotein-anchoring transpeptidase ErfK/SrfK
MRRVSVVRSSLLLAAVLAIGAVSGLMTEQSLSWAEGGALREATPEELAQEVQEAEARGEVVFRDGTTLLPVPSRSKGSSADLPVGDELAELLRSTPDAPAASTRAVMEVFKDPRALGIPYEFALLTVDGVLSKVFVISTGAPGKYTIEGSYSIKIPTRPGTGGRAAKAFPWWRSSKYANSPMFWGLQIRGGYFTHSTPHYGELGRRASMGCVRMTFPGAMELWDEVVNRVDGSAVIHIYGPGSAAARSALAAKGFDSAWLVQQIETDLGDAHAITRGDYEGVGHARRGQTLVFPSCDGVDCFEYFGKRKPRD